MKTSPPKRALQFLRWFCREDYLEEIEGDLTEVYIKEAETFPRKARWKFTWSVVKCFRPEFMKSFKNKYPSNSYGMYKSYFKIGWRNIIKHKTLSFINVAGLSAGLTCFTLVALWVTDEMSYDKFNENYDRIVRVIGTTQTESGAIESAVTSAPMSQALKNDFPEVENAVRLAIRGDIVTYKNQQLYQPDILLADPSFFDIFSFPLSRGNPATALNEPYSIILTQSSAKKYFGENDPIGENLTINMYDGSGYGALYKITGVMPDPPKNSHFRFTMLASFKTIEIANPDVLTLDGWGDSSFYTYILLKDGVDQKAFSEKISHFYGKYVGDLFDIWRNLYSYKLQPLRDIHLHSNLQNEIGPTGSINNVYLFSAIGIFVLLLAGINYINLAIAGSINRAKEVGIKKVVGALKGQLIAQYLVESVFTTLFALGISLLMSWLLQAVFTQLTGKILSPFDSLSLLYSLLFVSILLGICSGAYPAMILSGFEPLKILKGNYQHGESGLSLRKSLLVVQFTITIVLVTSIIIVNSQMNFIKHKDLGYNNEALLFLRVHGNTDVIKGFAAFKNELLTNPLISIVATSNAVPGAGFSHGESETIDRNGKSIQLSTARLRTDSDYFAAYGINLMEGRNFTSEAAKDTIQPIIINEAAVRMAGWESPQAAIGKPFRIGGTYGEVIGVVQNFHFASLHDRIEPLAIYPVGERFSRITINLNHSESSAAIVWLERTWRRHFPSSLLDYDFVDRQIGEQYWAEEQFSKIVLSFSFMSLVIACLGLYGLVSYAATQKVKEIGIRKVLGATINSIIVLLSGSYFMLLGISLFISVPIAYYMMSRWLENFAYRTSISWWMFVVAGSMVIAIALITVSVQAIKAALMNPVKSLRSE